MGFSLYALKDHLLVSGKCAQPEWLVLWESQKVAAFPSPVSGMSMRAEKSQAKTNSWKQTSDFYLYRVEKSLVTRKPIKPEDSPDLLGFPQTQKVLPRTPLLSSVDKRSIHTLYALWLLSALWCPTTLSRDLWSWMVWNPASSQPNWATCCGRQTHAHQYLGLFYFWVYTGFHFSVTLKLGIAMWLVIAMKSKWGGHRSLSISFLVPYPPALFLWALVY